MRANVRVHDVALMQFERKQQEAQRKLAKRVDVLWIVLAVVMLLLTVGVLVTAGMGGR